MSEESESAWEWIGADDPVTAEFRWRLKRMSQKDDFGDGYRAGRRWLVKEANVFETACLSRYLGGNSMREIMRRASADCLNGKLPEAIAHRMSGSDDWNWGWLEGALTHLHELEQRTGFKV